MSFIDKVRIYVQAGKGGAGCLSFRREKYIPFGGPNGGNGGKGGDCYLISDNNLTTLLDLTYRPHFKAQDGSPGQSSDKTGKCGEDLYIPVPCGTQVFLEDKLIGDLREHRQTLLCAQGGRGGRGNASFKTSRNSAPRIAEKGEPGQNYILDLELKLIADVGLIGCPNAGKSTLLARISSARPKIADYPFTTLTPNLGVVQFKEKNFVAADIPGLIEGAHEGKGLGTEFLKHIERTKILIHLIDPMGFGGKTALSNFRSVTKELSLYSKKLSKKPCLTVINKMDCTGAKERLAKLKKQLKNKKIMAISAVSGEGIPILIKEAVQLLSKQKTKSEQEPESAPVEFKKFVFGREFSVQREEAGFRVKGEKVERLFAMTNFAQEEAAQRFQNILKKMGVEKLLIKEGIQPGDTVLIGNMEFTFTLGQGNSPSPQE